MNIEWVRGNVRAALDDTYIAGNGQLGDLAERARVETSRFNRNPPRFIAVNGRMVRVPSYPLTTKQTRVKGESVALIHEVDYYLVSWRRAISRLDEPLQAWIRYCYGGYPYRNEQPRVVPYVWDKFIEQQTGRISGKVKQRLQGLVLLAVQVVGKRPMEDVC
ncbi:hypothetical protein BK025_00055, partial [Sodalis sp. TME1]